MRISRFQIVHRIFILLVLQVVSITLPFTSFFSPVLRMLSYSSGITIIIHATWITYTIFLNVCNIIWWISISCMWNWIAPLIAAPPHTTWTCIRLCIFSDFFSIHSKHFPVFQQKKKFNFKYFFFNKVPRFFAFVFPCI